MRFSGLGLRWLQRVDAQRALFHHERPDGVRVRVRIGLHTGEPVIGEEGYAGLDVIRAARIGDRRRRAGAHQ